jgi:hypothetical protein
MFFLPIIFAADVLSAPQQLEEEEITLSEKTAMIEEDVAEDGELIFDDEEPVVELEE